MTAVVRGKGWTPLMYAAAAGDVKSVKLLIEGKAEVDTRSAPTGVTALMLAAGGGHVEIVTALLSYHADLHAVDLARRRAYDYAYLAGHDDLGRDLEVRESMSVRPGTIPGGQKLKLIRTKRPSDDGLEP